MERIARVVPVRQHGLLVLMLLMLSLAGWASAADGVRLPALDAATPERVSTALAEMSAEVLEGAGTGTQPLTDLQRGQLQLVAARYQEAATTLGGLVASLEAGGERSRAQRLVPYLLHARAHAVAGDVAQAYARVFAQHFMDLDDVAALQTQYWFVGNAGRAQAQLEQLLQAHADAERVPLAVALELARLQAFVQTYGMAQARAAGLIEADAGRRFLVDDSVMIDVGDGIRLSAHLARGRTASGPLPAAMVFTIYTDPQQNRATAMMAAAHGYAGIVVDARGKRLGEGAPAPYETEGRDAHAAIDWISRQPWNDGRVAMYGGSYLGFAAWAAAAYRHPALKTIVPYVAAMPGLGLPMENNVFLTANYAWPFYVASNRLLDHEANNDHARWNAMAGTWYRSGRPYREIDQVDGTPNPWLQRWLAHPAYDAYWQAMVPYAGQFAGITIPVLSITGYYDDGQVSALQYFNEHLRHLPQAGHTLVIGPYDHFGAQSASKSTQLRGYTIDPTAQFDTEALTFAWLDHVLRGAPRPALLQGRVNAQLMGADTWVHADTLDEAGGGRVPLYLTGGAGGSDSHVLAAHPGKGQLELVADLADRAVVRNGYYPSPIVHASLEIDSGLVFTSEPFTEPMAVIGQFSGALQVRINKRDVDLSMVLYELMADGRAMQLAYHVGRASHAADMTTRRLLVPGEWTTLPIERARMTGRLLAPGSRLVVVVDVLQDAMHQVNHGTGGDVSDESVADAGAPLRLELRGDSVIRVPLRPAPERLPGN